MLRTTLCLMAAVVLAAGVVAGSAAAESKFVTKEYQALWNAPAVADRIEAGIKQNRMAAVTVNLKDAAGKPVAGAEAAVEQIGHEFLFGANIFLFKGFDTEEKNRRYEDAFVGLFNAASVPLYWKTLEPKQGQIRFEATSEPIYRRPPPDIVVAFCKAHGLNMNGHTLVWDNTKWAVPTWLPADLKERERLIAKRIGEIAARYGKDIQRWDVVNERGSLTRKPSAPLPERFELKAFLEAQKVLPPTAILNINETTGRVWGKEKETYRNLIETLRKEGARIDMVGIQFHFFSNEGLVKVLKGESFKPADMLATLDFMGEVGLPMHISEITLSSLDDSADGREAQAVAATNFYRLFFSHPRMAAVTWWNVADGTAAPGEDHIPSGMIDRDLKPKPAYEALHRLIHQEWKTRLKATSGAAGDLAVNGFKGRYRVTVQQGGKTLTGEFTLTAGAKAPVEVVVK